MYSPGLGDAATIAPSICSGRIWSHWLKSERTRSRCSTAVCSSTTSTLVARPHGLGLEKPLLGSAPIFQVKAMSFAVTGTPSPHCRSGLSLIVTAMPFLPSGRSSIFASPLSSVGNSVQSRQEFFQSGPNAVIWRTTNPIA